MKFKTILFDFDGVICRDFLYTPLQKKHPEVWDFIQNKVFKDEFIFHDWMKGKLTQDQINDFISQNTKTDKKDIEKSLTKSVNLMKLDKRMLNLAKRLKKAQIKTAIVSNNVEMLTAILVKKHRLDQIFSLIINSFDFGLLKTDKKGKLFDIVLNELNHNSFKDCLLIDDGLKNREVFRQKGGQTFDYNYYKHSEKFETLENFVINSI